MQPASVAKLLGASVLLPCVATGSPAPHIRWMFGDKLLEERYESHYISSVLIFLFLNYIIKAVLNYQFLYTLIFSVLN